MNDLVEVEGTNLPVPASDKTAVEAEADAELQRIIPANFHVQCAKTAAWVVRKIVEARQYSKAVKVWAEMEQRRAAREEERLLFLFGDQLRRWAKEEIQKLKGRRRSLALPSGTVGFRTAPSHLHIRDENTVKEWARQACPAALVISERLLKTPIFEHFEHTGEVPQGAEIEPPHDEFYIR